MTPDYSRYTRKELEEALETIDYESFPERVEQIKQALAAMESHQDMSPAPAAEQDVLLPEPVTPEQAQHKLLGRLALIFAGLILGAMLLPAYFHSFLLNDEMVSLFKWLAWATGLVTFVITNKKMLHTDYLRKANANLIAQGKRPMALNSARRFGGAVLCALIIGLTATYAVYRGAPVALHLYVMDKKHVSEVVTVAKLNHRYRQKHCSGKIYLQEYASRFFDYVCQVTPRSQWERLRPGQKIHLHGTRSELGFLVIGATL